jgi:hypothetical protein
MIENNLLRSLVVTGLLVAFLVGAGVLLWASFQSYETLSKIADLFASDGRLESFTFERYGKFILSFRIAGIVFLMGFGLEAIFWRATQQLLSKIHEWLLRSTKNLFRDAKQVFSGLAWKLQSNVDRICLVGFTLLSIVPRASQMNTEFRHDESYTYISFASKSLWQTVSDYHLPNNHVFFSVILNLTARLMGNQQWMLRVPSVLFGVLMVPMVYLLSKKLYNRETAILSSTLVALFPEFIWGSTNARGYILLALIVLMVAGLAAYVRTKKNNFAWLMITVLSALGFFTIPIMSFPFGGIFLWLFLSGAAADFESAYETRWDFFKYWFISLISTVVLATFLYSPILITDANSLLANNFVIPRDASVFFSVFQGRLINTWNRWRVGIPIWLVSIFVIGFGVGLSLHRRYANHKVPTQIAFVIAAALIVVVLRPDVKPRMWSIVLAIVLMWCAVGIAVLLKWLRARRDFPLQSILVSLMLFVLLAQNVQTMRTMPDNWSHKTDLEVISAYFKDKLVDGDVIVIDPTYSPMLVYQCVVRDIPTLYFRRDEPYQYAYIVVYSPTETVEGVVNRSGPLNPKIDSNTIEFVDRIGFFQIYGAEPLR